MASKSTDSEDEDDPSLLEQFSLGLEYDITQREAKKRSRRAFKTRKQQLRAIFILETAYPKFKGR